MCPRVYAASSFPIANSARGPERSLDPGRWRADKAARSVSVWPNPPWRTTDHALARRQGKPRRFPLASAFHLRLFRWRQLCLQRIRDFVSEIALDRENVGHIAVVIVGPDVLIGVGIDQLHVHAHPVSRAAHASLENIGNPERLADFAKVRRPASVLHHRGARNHPEIAYLRQDS